MSQASSAVLFIVPRRYLNTAMGRPMTQVMPKDIHLDNTPEAKKALRIAAMMHSANVLERAGLLDAAKFLRAKSHALKSGIPDGCDSFADDDQAPSIQIIDGKQYQTEEGTTHSERIDE